MNKAIRNIVVITMGAIALGQVGQLQAADANPPERMTYQGFLVDGNGAALGNSAPANYDVVFRIYNAKSGGTPIWSEQQTVTVDKGYFSVLLGEGSQVNSEDYGSLSTAFVGADVSDRFIGLTMSGLGGGNVEIAPRLRLVTSPYSFTASQARRLTDGSGNANFFKDGATLKLGAGSTPTLTLPEAGGASLVGTLTVGLPGWGTGLQIDNGSTTTTIGAQNSGLFHFNTGLPQFYFNKKITVAGDIRSYNTDTILGPSNNTDTYLKISSSSDKIEARADQFVVQGDSKYLEVKFTSTAAELRSDASKFYINRPLEVEGALTISGDIMTSGWIGRTAHNKGGLVGSHNNVGSNGSKTNPIYVIGSSYKPAESTLSNMYGVGYADGGASYITGNASGWGLYVAADGDARTFLSGGAGHSYISKNGGRVGIGTDSPRTTLDVTGNIAASGSLLVSGSTGLRNVTGQYGSVQTTGNGVSNYEGYSIDGRYVFMSYDNNNYGFYNDIDNQWVTLFEKTAVSGGRYRVWTNGTQVLQLQRTNGSRYASYDGDSNWDFYSDRRLKEDIAKEDNLLDRIMSLDVVNYNFIGEEKKKHKEIGFIAQNIERHFPSLVSETEDDRYDFDVKSVGYSTFGVIAVGGIKELKKEKDTEIAELRSENETLKSRMETLTSEMAVLKARLANSTTQEDRIAKLEELVGKIGQGQ